MINYQTQLHIESPCEVLIIGEQPIMMLGIARVIENGLGMVPVVQAKNLVETRYLLATRAPGLIILDVDLNNGKGIELIDQVFAYDCEANVIVLTEQLSGEQVFAAIKKGIKAIVSKQTSPEEIGRCIDTVLAGGTYFSPHFLSAHAVHAKAGEMTVSVRNMNGTKVEEEEQEEALPDLSRFTCTELHIMALISEGYKTKEISRIRESSPATVRRHRHNICQKLSLHENNALILFAMQYKALLFPYLQQA